MFLTISSILFVILDRVQTSSAHVSYLIAISYCRPKTLTPNWLTWIVPISILIFSAASNSNRFLEYETQVN